MGNAIYLKIYDQKAVGFLFAQTEEVFAKKLTTDQKKIIIGLTGGHTKLTKIVSELSLQENKTFEKEQLLQNHQVQASLFEIWLFLTAEEQRALYDISKAQLPIPNKVREKLAKFDLVDKDLNFTIPILKEFVKAMPPDAFDEKIVFNPTTKEITKGENTISELLSPQEYRLLRFLIENHGRIVERDELIGAVWPNVQVIEAVSDEAIDQMIFRLRKKIENQPNKPKHLQTVKGRGIRFVP